MCLPPDLDREPSTFVYVKRAGRGGAGRGGAGRGGAGRGGAGRGGANDIVAGRVRAQLFQPAEFLSKFAHCLCLLVGGLHDHSLRV